MPKAGAVIWFDQGRPWAVFTVEDIALLVKYGSTLCCATIGVATLVYRPILLTTVRCAARLDVKPSQLVKHAGQMYSPLLMQNRCFSAPGLAGKRSSRQRKTVVMTRESNMKTLIVGTGVIGTIYGWALQEAGVDVTHFVRKGKKDQCQDGLNLDILDERKGHLKYSLTKYTLKCVEKTSLSDGYELIIVPTNMHQIEDALKSLVPVSGQATFLIFSGNWEGTGYIDQLLPRERYLMGYADGGGTIRDGAYWANLGAEVHLGAVDEKANEKLEQVKALLVRADMQPDVQENIVHWLWQHAAGAIGFAMGFAKYGDIKTFLNDKELVRKCVRSTKELYRLCELRGVDLKKYPEAGFISFPDWLVTFLVRWNITHREAAQRYSAHGASAGSQQEIKLYYSLVMKDADKLGLDMPHTKALATNLK
jgi:2-dehydropantoate 2-reductase